MNELLFAGGPGAGGRYGEPVAAARADRGGAADDQRPEGRPPSRRIGRSYGRAGGSLKMRGSGEAGPDHTHNYWDRLHESGPASRRREIVDARSPRAGHQRFRSRSSFKKLFNGQDRRLGRASGTWSVPHDHWRPTENPAGVATVIARQLKDLIVDDWLRLSYRITANNSSAS